MKNNKKKIYFPLKLIVLYVMGTLLLNIIGPWKYYGENKVLVALYILFFLICTSVTYVLAIKKISEKGNNINKIEFRPDKFIKFAIVILMLISCILLFSGIFAKGIPSFSNIAEQMARSYTNIGIGIVTEKRDWPLWLFIHCGFFVYSGIVLGLVYFKQIKKVYKSMLLISILFIMIYFMLYVGTQKTLADIIILGISAMMIKIGLIDKKVTIQKKLLLIIVAISVFMFFAIILNGRLSYWNNENSLKSISNHFAWIDTNNFIYKIIPKNLQMGILMAIFYISHGYYGLALCLKQPFVWTFGLGSVFDIRDIMTRYFGLGAFVDGHTYIERVEAATGWSSTEVWHTVFPWLASDFTFIGAILVLCVFIYIYATSWYEILYYKRWQSILMFSFLNIMWFYIPATNQMFQTRITTIIFIITFIIWISRNAKVRKKNNG